MPLPLVLLSAALGSVATVGVAEAGKLAIKKALDVYGADLEKWAIGAAAEKFGLVLDADDGVSAEAINAAINAGPLAGTGIELTNIFDKQALISDLRQVAMMRAGEALGLGQVRSIAGLRDGARAMLIDEVAAQLAVESGPLVEGAPDVALVGKAIASRAKTAGWNTPTDLTPKGIANRARQARWRVGKTKHWEPRA